MAIAGHTNRTRCELRTAGKYSIISCRAVDTHRATVRRIIRPKSKHAQHSCPTCVSCLIRFVFLVFHAHALRGRCPRPRVRCRTGISWTRWSDIRKRQKAETQKHRRENLKTIKKKKRQSKKRRRPFVHYYTSAPVDDDRFRSTCEAN